MTRLLTPQLGPTPHSSEYLEHSLYTFKEFDVLIVKAKIPILLPAPLSPPNIYSLVPFSLWKAPNTGSDQSVLTLLPGTPCVEELGPKDSKVRRTFSRPLRTPRSSMQPYGRMPFPRLPPLSQLAHWVSISLFACKILRDGHTKHQTLDRNQTVTSPPSQHSMQIRAPGSSWDQSAEPSDSQFLSHRAGPGRLPANVLQLVACCRPGTVPRAVCP